MTATDQIKNRSGLLAWAIFLPALGATILTLISVVFPALILGSINVPKFPVNIFEPGVFAYPLIATNLILAALGILYLKKRLPNIISRSIRFVFNFEISTHVAALAIVVLFCVYIVFSASEIIAVDPWEDYKRVVEPALKTWSLHSFISNPGDPNLVYLLGVISMKVFGYYTIIPVIASLGLLLLTYYITKEIAQKRFAGIVSMVLLLQSGIFLTYDSTITYPNFWILLYLFSLYLIVKKWPPSPVSFILSVSSKAITAAFLPLTFLFTWLADIQRRTKIRASLAYIGIILVLVIIFVSLHVNPAGKLGFNWHRFWEGFGAVSMQFRYDEMIILFLLPLTVGLFLVARSGIKNANAVLALIMGTLWLGALLPALTIFDNNPYRFIPLVVFFAIGVGTLLSRRATQV